MSEFAEIGERLKTVRSYYNLSQEKMAGYFGISQPAYVYYEKGVRKMDRLMLRLLETDFRINTDWLLEGKGSMFVSDASSPRNLPSGQLLDILSKLDEDFLGLLVEYAQHLYEVQERTRRKYPRRKK